MNIYKEIGTIKLAEQIHKNDRYGEYHYMYHLHAVMEVALQLYGEEWATKHHQLIYLHDAIEDHPECKQQIMDLGDWDLVENLEQLNKNNFTSRRPYLNYLKKEAEKSRFPAYRVKICDTISNLQESVKIGDMKRIERYAWQLNYLMED